MLLRWKKVEKRKNSVNLAQLIVNILKFYMRILQRLAGTRITSSDIAVLFMRFFAFCYLLNRYGLIWGLAIIITISLGLEHIIIKMHDVEPLNQVDKNVFYD